jgi:hypothetical protein
MSKALAELYSELALYEAKDLSAHNWLEKRQIERRIRVVRGAIKRLEEEKDKANVQR